MADNKIRPIALGIIRRPSDGALLLDKGYDYKEDKCFYRPLGGGIEFFEKSDEALVREFQEEIGKEIEIGKLLFVDENLFEFEGNKGHQIMFIYECVFKNKADYDLPEIKGVEKPDNLSVWRRVADVKAEGAVIYPVKVMEI